MSAVVVLSFVKRADAAKFVKSMYSEKPNAEQIGTDAFAGEVAATIARPDLWCTCEGQQEPGATARRGRRKASKREAGWTRDPKTGLFVCYRCSKPAKAIVIHFISSMLIGGVDMTPQILGTGEPLDLFAQRVLEASNAALDAGREPDMDTLTSFERLHLRNTPNGVGDPTYGSTVALGGGGTPRREGKRKARSY